MILFEKSKPLEKKNIHFSNLNRLFVALRINPIIKIIFQDLSKLYKV